MGRNQYRSWQPRRERERLAWRRRNLPARRIRGIGGEIGYWRADLGLRRRRCIDGGKGFLEADRIGLDALGTLAPASASSSASRSRV